MLGIQADNFTDGSATTLAKSVCANEHIYQLNLSRNTLTKKYILDLCNKLISQSHSVRELIFSDVKANDDIAFSVSRILLSDSSISTINLLSNNAITKVGHAALTMTARSNIYISNLLRDVETDARAKEIFVRNKLISELLDSCITESIYNREIAIDLRVTGRPKPISAAEEKREQLFNQPHMTGSIDGRRFVYGIAERKGRRSAMEDVCLAKSNFRGNIDEHLFCVLDGHGGADCSRYVGGIFEEIFAGFLEEEGKGKDNPPVALREAFRKCNDLCREHHIKAGTCALVCYIKGSSLYTACVGDSQAVLGRREGQTLTAHLLSKIWKTSNKDEEERINAAGGWVSNGRVNGLLAVSRAIGDTDMEDLISAEPSVDEIELGSDDELLVLGCDGVWDFLKHQEAIDYLEDLRDPWFGSGLLRDYAYYKGSKDNISTIVIRLKDIVI